MNERRSIRTGVRFSAAYLADRGRVRKENQDACAADVKRGMFVVADGVGGAAAGAEAQVEVEVKAEKLSFVISSLVLRRAVLD